MKPSVDEGSDLDGMEAADGPELVGRSRHLGVVDDVALDLLFANDAVRKDDVVMLCEEDSDRHVLRDEVHKFLQGDGSHQPLQKLDLARKVESLQDGFDSTEVGEI